MARAARADRWRRPLPTPQHDTDGYILWTCGVGEQFLGNVCPEPEQIDASLECTVPAGEFAPIIVGLWGLRSLGYVGVSIEPEHFGVSIRCAEYKRYQATWPNSGKPRIFDIPRMLPEWHVDSVDAGRNTVFWITLDVPEDAYPGPYPATLKLDFTDGRPARTVPLTVNVLPLRIGRADIAFGMFYNLGRFPEDRRGWHDELRAFADMAEHGHTSMGFAGPPHDPDMMKLNAQIQARCRAGVLTDGVPFLLGGAGIDDADAWEDMSHAYRCQHYAKYGQKIRNRRMGSGWPEPVLYTDEVGQHHKYMLPIMEAARPYVRMASSMKCKRWETYKDSFDIWMISAGCAQPKFLDAAKAAGAEPWVYICNRRADNPLFERFYSGVYTWAHGLKGNFAWAYCDTPQGFSYVVPEADGPVPAIGWEARREGILDYRILHALDVVCAGKDSLWADAARVFMDDLRVRSHWGGKSYSKVGNEELMLAWEKTPGTDILAHEFPRIRRAALFYLQAVMAEGRE